MEKQVVITPARGIILWFFLQKSETGKVFALDEQTANQTEIKGLRASSKANFPEGA